MVYEAVKAVLIDDEPECLDNLEFYLNTYFKELQIAFKTTSITEGLEFIKNNNINIAFLDIMVFDENIFQALEREGLPDCKIVFVTAYDSFALKALKIDALDYILKPIDKKDIMNCCDKIKRVFSKQINSSENKKKSQNKTIILRQADKIYVIEPADIIYLEANGFYTVFCFMYGGEIKLITASKPLASAELEIGEDVLFRVHKSFSINPVKAKEIIKRDGILVRMQGEKEIPVSKRKAVEFLELIKALNASKN